VLHVGREAAAVAANEPIDPRVRLATAQWPVDASRGAVTTFCAEHDISRKTFYELRKRCEVRWASVGARALGETAAVESVAAD
jgi:hypothetical protein